MNPLIFTYYTQAATLYGEPMSADWPEWIKIFSEHIVRGLLTDTHSKAALDLAKDGPALVLAEIPKGRPRGAQEVTQAYALSLDLDHSDNDQLTKIFDTLSPYEYFLWSTHKHGSVVAGPCARLRVVLPLTQPLARPEHTAAWHSLQELVGGANDPQTKDISRLNYLPSTFDPTKTLTQHNQGRWLDAAIDLPIVEVPTEQPEHTLSGMQQKQALHVLRQKIGNLRKADRMKEPLQAVLHGRSFAEPGHRHAMVLDLTIWLAMENPALDAAVLQELFRDSLIIMATLQNDAPQHKEIWDAYHGAVTKFAQLAKDNAEQREHKVQQEQLTQAQQVDIGSYTPADLERIASAQGWTPAQLANRWVVQKDGCCFFLDSTGNYIGPFSKEDLPLAINENLARTTIRLLVEQQNGAFRHRSPTEVIRDAGSLIHELVADMTINRSVFDPVTRVFNEAIRPIQHKLTPKFNPKIDIWLQHLGGPVHSKLIDWMSCCPDLKKLLCAIYIEGAPGSGKTLLAVGLAKLWTNGPPADVSCVFDPFNDDITRCPLILADEGIEDKHKNSATTVLRSQISIQSRILKRKFMPVGEVRGAVRIMLTANNEFLLASDGVSSTADLEAIAQRFLYIYAGQAATDYINTISKLEVEDWLGQGIAEHALYLQANHQIVSPGKRFWVEGTKAEMHRRLLTGSRWNSLVCEWLVRYLLAPSLLDQTGRGFIRRLDGRLYVNDQAILDNWGRMYIQTRLECEALKIGAALKAISSTDKKKQMRWGSKRIRYREIDTTHLVSWAEQYNMGDEETIQKALHPTADVLAPKFGAGGK